MFILLCPNISLHPSPIGPDREEPDCTPKSSLQQQQLPLTCSFPAITVYAVWLSAQPIEVVLVTTRLELGTGWADSRPVLGPGMANTSSAHQHHKVTSQAQSSPCLLAGMQRSSETGQRMHLHETPKTNK